MELILRMVFPLVVMPEDEDIGEASFEEWPPLTFNSYIVGTLDMLEGGKLLEVKPWCKTRPRNPVSRIFVAMRIIYLNSSWAA